MSKIIVIDRKISETLRFNTFKLFFQTFDRLLGKRLLKSDLGLQQNFPFRTHK